MTEANVGISGLAAYLPSYRVKLQDWCNWNTDNWSKISTVVGSSFRMRAPDENAYTMAATAVLRLIEQYEIDPSQVGCLALGTESSTDNSAGAVIVKGMVNTALREAGLQEISRACEVPEFKHACLGGVYAMKAAARYLALDGRDRIAIVVCSDIAEYERGTSGEPTQGAGAVAMLVENDPKMLRFELNLSGSASDYRGPDFRKPFSRFTNQTLEKHGQPRDFPVFNGKYSATCYVDEVLAAMKDLFKKVKSAPSAFMRELGAVFLHRPYLRMAETGLIMSLLYSFALGDDVDQSLLDEYARMADVDGRALRNELLETRNVYELVENESLSIELFPLASATAKAFRKTEDFEQLVVNKLRLGGEQMSEVGNLYTASLPVWLAAGLEQAVKEELELTDSRFLTIGYGSGDAAEVIPMRVVDGWQTAAHRIEFSRSLAIATDLDQAGYETLHDTGELDEPPTAQDAFYIASIGARDRHFDDSGIEYYKYRKKA